MRTLATLRRIALPALALACAAPGCAGGGDTIVIGTAGPFKEGYATMVRHAVEMAVAEANARGGVKGRRLEVMAVDDEGDGVKAGAAARGFYQNANVVGVVGHANSGGMVGAAPEYDRGLPAVVPSATSPEITGISPWVFRVTVNDSVNGANLARYAAGLGDKRVVVLYENNVYGRDLAQAFLAAYPGHPVGVDPIAGDGSKVEPFISYYKRVQPDLVFVAGTEQSGRALLAEAVRQGFHTQWLAGDGWPGVAVDTAAAEGALIATPVRLDGSDQGRRFADDFAARYGVRPDANAAMAYDAAMLLVKAIGEVGPDRARIRDYLATVKGGNAFRGVTGDIRFRPDGDPDRSGFVMTRVRNGTLVPQEEAR
ncbi:MAG TPA: branched-chain amino acid ABC transporter substrate-binding protein [Longimicrobium sp.]|nr:branched-chain amino acid ABC transporter substrate-binding protein [Longimicrobium sp.]